MPRSPFKVSTPAGTPAQKPRPTPVTPGDVYQRALDKKLDLVTAGQEVMQPDYEVESTTPEAVGEHRTTYKQANPVPQAAERRPFRVR